MFKVKQIKRKFLCPISIRFFFLASKKLCILRNLAHVLLFLTKCSKFNSAYHLSKTKMQGPIEQD